jgi:phosphatidylglycerol:prolipoprotein diacylglycerol transferase
MHPDFFSTRLFGLLSEPWSFHFYGLLIAVGFILGVSLAARQAEREGENSEQLIDLCFNLLLAGLLGARVVFILTKLPEFMADPLDVFKIWRGGLVWYGGFIGAVVYVGWYSRRHRLNFLKLVDLLIPSAALAHAFGRIGCLTSGCCHGGPTTQPWGIVFPPYSYAHAQQLVSHLIGPYQPTLAVHPTQLYEASAELALFWFLVLLRPYKRFHGQLFLAWLAAYPVLRSIIEIYRGDSERGVYGEFSTSQYLSVFVGLSGALLWAALRYQRRNLADRVGPHQAA